MIEHIVNDTEVVMSDSSLHKLKGSASTKTPNNDYRKSYDEVFKYPFTYCRTCDEPKKKGCGKECPFNNVPF